MNRAHIIKKQLDKAGRCVYLKDGEWTSTPIRATISHLWRKKTSSFEPKYTELGMSRADYYLYIGPYNHDITSLSQDAVLTADGEQYEFKCADAVLFGEEVIYYTGILKRLTGADISED
ncbi:MAG: hypothetical protein J1E36_05935 [Eubacterium sp.]|nr:hypothetical protein [Eubacterium sp.]